MSLGGRRNKLPFARRELGQCFLVNAGVRDKILAALDPGPDDWVVEIGPGPGVLTSSLTELSGHVVAVELDLRLAEELPSRVSRPDLLEVVNLDAARLDYAAIARRARRPLLVVGNLPFNAAAHILREALAQGEHLGRLVFMFQKEVARRLASPPGQAAYGLLSVVTQQRARVERLFEVAPGSFVPAPKVSAGVLRLTPHLVPTCCMECHDLLVRHCFAHRRKTLRNNLRTAPWPWERVAGWLAAEGIREDQRAEELDVATYLRLAKRACPEGHIPRWEGSCA